MKRRAQISKGYGGIRPTVSHAEGCDSEIFLMKKAPGALRSPMLADGNDCYRGSGKDHYFLSSSLMAIRLKEI